MPKNRVQALVFGLLMSVTMVVGMEVYNSAWQLGFAARPGGFSTMTNEVFLHAAGEVGYMTVIVFVISELFGNHVGATLAQRLTDPERDSRFFGMLVRSGCTVAVMCPTMALVASILFNLVLGGRPVIELPAIWIGTIIKNFPMALLWNIYAAGPLTRTLFRRFFSRLGE